MALKAPHTTTEPPTSAAHSPTTDVNVNEGGETLHGHSTRNTCSVTVGADDTNCTNETVHTPGLYVHNTTQMGDVHQNKWADEAWWCFFANIQLYLSVASVQAAPWDRGQHGKQPAARTASCQTETSMKCAHTAHARVREDPVLRPATYPRSLCSMPIST